MTYFLWFLTIIFSLQALAILRAKYSLRQLKSDFSKYKTNNEYLEVTRSHATKKMQKYIATNLPHIEAAGYRLMREYIKPKSSMIDHHVLFTSASQDSIIELVYFKHTLAQRLILAICGSKYCIQAETFTTCAESYYSNDEVLITATMEPAVFPAWVHATFLELKMTAEDVM